MFSLGLVPAQAFRASRSEAAPYGSDNGKSRLRLKSKVFIQKKSGSFLRWGSFQITSSRNPQLRSDERVCRKGFARLPIAIPGTSEVR
jgi:hypothetical protein